MSREELLRQRKNVAYVLLVVFAIGFFAAFFIMDIPNIYYNESYSIKIDGVRNGRGVGLFKKLLSNDVYLYAGNVDEFYPGIEVEAITLDSNTMKIDIGYGSIHDVSQATLTIRNTNTGERYNVRGAADSADDTVPYISLADVMSVVGYDYSLNSIIRTINVKTY